MKKIINRGFTLIELLVVIAIIGILASIVLVSLNSARSKGKDTRVISDVKEVQTQLEAEASAGGSYQAGAGLCVVTPGTSSGSAVSAFAGNCSTLKTDSDSNSGSALVVRTNAASQSATSFTAYVVYSALASNPNNYFCSDSTGNVKTETAAPPASGVTCW